MSDKNAIFAIRKKEPGPAEMKVKIKAKGSPDEVLKGLHKIIKRG
jgi:hypothetical protein